MPEGHGGARASLLERHPGAGHPQRTARADRGARQLAARAGQVPGRHQRRGDRRPEHSHRHPARLRARRLAQAAHAFLPRRSGRSGAAHRRRIGARQGQGLIRLFFLGWLLFAGTAQAASPEELAALRKRIDALTAELQRKESTQREARDALRDSERAISEVNRTLAGIESESRAVRADAARLGAQRQALEQRLAAQQQAVERMLVARYAGGAPDAVRIALSGDDPGALGRRLQYAADLSRAAAALIASYREGLRRLAQLAEEAQAKRARLGELEDARRADRG